MLGLRDRGYASPEGHCGETETDLSRAYGLMRQALHFQQKCWVGCFLGTRAECPKRKLKNPKLVDIYGKRENDCC